MTKSTKRFIKVDKEQPITDLFNYPLLHELRSGGHFKNFSEIPV